jgi:hypothetical protein
MGSALDVGPIKARMAALVVPLPWEITGHIEDDLVDIRSESVEWSDGSDMVPKSSPEAMGIAVACDMFEEEADFFLHAPADISSLIAEVERLRAQLGEGGA